MNYLLKIVEGPMKGAEIALVGGTTVKFGSGDDCDIIVADAALDAIAAELEVTEEGVNLHKNDGSVEPLELFEIRDFGTTSIAIGPAEGKWQELKRVEKAPEPKPEEAAPAAETKPAEAPAKGKRHFGCLVTIVIFVLALVALFFVGKRLNENHSKLITWLTDRFASSNETVVVQAEAVQKGVVAPPSIDEIVKSHGLKLVDGKITGNLKRRTERLAIRAMALAADPAVKFDLTDDETLFTSSSELLFACSDGMLRVAAASNRTVAIAGYAPSAKSLEKSLRALNDDVKGIDKVETALVRVGGVPPPPVDPRKPETKLPPLVENKSLEIPSPSPKERPNYPIAGILTAPYPCVVMRNGMRLVEGAQIGTATLIKIEAEKLTLKDGNTVFTWNP